MAPVSPSILHALAAMVGLDLDLDVKALHNRDSEATIIATSNMYLNPKHFQDVGSLGMAHSPTALCRTFDVTADGYVKSEAVSGIISSVFQILFTMVTPFAVLSEEQPQIQAGFLDRDWPFWCPCWPSFTSAQVSTQRREHCVQCSLVTWLRGGQGHVWCCRTNVQCRCKG